MCTDTDEEDQEAPRGVAVEASLRSLGARKASSPRRTWARAGRAEDEVEVEEGHPAEVSPPDTTDRSLDPV